MSTNPIPPSDQVQALRRPVAFQHGDGVNIETLSAGKTLTIRSEQVQALNGGLANRDITLPPPVVPDHIGHPYRIYNSGATNNLVVKTSAASTLATLLPGQFVDVEHGPANYVLTAKGGAGAGGSDFGAPGLLTDVVAESTSAAGVTVDGALIKDGGATLQDSTTAIVDNSDATKKLAFQASGITTGTTRTWTAPDQDLGVDQFLHKATTTIANAAVRTLNATPVSIVPAPGAGKAIVDVRVSVKYVYATAAFDSVGAGDDLEIRYTDGSGAKVANDIETTGMLDQASDQYRMVGPISTVLTPVANAAVVLRLATGEVYAAAGGGSLVVQAYYRIVTL